MDLKWYYTAENDGKTSPVATLYKANGCPVLQVYKGKDAYFSRPYGEYAQHIDRIKATYEDVNRFVEEQCEVPNNLKNEAKLKFACASIEVDFRNKADAILTLFS